MKNSFSWYSAPALLAYTRTRPLLVLVMATAGAGGLWMLFLHLMQRSAVFAETVAKISPEIANTYGCSCPFCSGKACLPPADQQGLERFHGRFPL